MSNLVVVGVDGSAMSLTAVEGAAAAAARRGAELRVLHAEVAEHGEKDVGPARG